MQSRRAEAVELYSSQSPIRQHVDVALLEVTQTEDFNEQGTDLMIRKMRETAGEMGCDAIVIGGRSERGPGKFSSASHSMQATCVVYTAPPR